MPLLVPLLAALAVVLAAVMLWVWAGSIARVRHGGLVASGASVLASGGVFAMVADASLEWIGWSLIALAALALAGGWVALSRWGMPAASESGRRARPGARAHRPPR